MKRLVLEVRTPSGVALEEPVSSIVAEDLSGWFGVRPGREDLVAALPAGLLVARTAGSEGGEHFVAHAGGMLDLSDGRCRVLVSEATVANEVEGIAERLAESFEARRARGDVRRGVMDDLEREAVRRLVKEARA